jgi:nucleotide-binding universal stress UspA family protein
LYKRIVVAYDGSEGAQAALRKASELARASGAGLSLVGCTGRFRSEAQGGALDDPDPQAGERARESLEAAASGLGGIDVSVEVLAGNPPQEIVGFAERSGADLIVTGSRGRAMLPQAVLGRVTSAIVSNAPCDVLVVEPIPG